MITSTQSSPSQSAISETLSAKPLGISDTQSSQLAGIGALSEREALQLKLDSGHPLTPVEQGTLERLSAADQSASGSMVSDENHRERLLHQTSPGGSTIGGDYIFTHPNAEANLLGKADAQRAADEAAHTMVDTIGDTLFDLKTFLLPTIKGRRDADDFTVIGATPQDIADLNSALEYLQSKDENGNWRSETAVDLLDSMPEGTVIRINNIGLTAVDYITGDIYWDPRAGVPVFDANGRIGTQSPALGLVHEIDHALNSEEAVPTYDSYVNTEERRVITGTESQIAKDLGEPLRDNHRVPPVRVDASIPPY